MDCSDTDYEGSATEPGRPTAIKFVQPFKVLIEIKGNYFLMKLTLDQCMILVQEYFTKGLFLQRIVGK